MTHRPSLRAAAPAAVLAAVAVLTLALRARGQDGAPPPPPEPANPQKRPLLYFEWLGHAAFVITAGEGGCVLIDPYDERLGLTVPLAARALAPDHILISHEHFAHDHPGLFGREGVAVHRGATGRPRSRFASLEPFEAGALSIRAVLTFHDAEQGARLGENAVFVIDYHDVRIVHAGALGHVLDEEQVRAIGRADVLLVPVGGRFTLDASGARAVADQLRARVIVPMAFATDAAAGRPVLPIATVEPFVRLFPEATVTRLPGGSFSLVPGRMPAEREVRVLALAP